MSTCLYPGCSGKHKAKGLCRKHYMSAYSKEYRTKNGAKIKMADAKYKQANREKEATRLAAYRKQNAEKVAEYRKVYAAANKATRNAKRRLRRLNDPHYLVSCRVRGAVNRCLKAAKIGKTVSTEKLLGCSFVFFVSYLESLFQPGMGWDNHGEWHLDHRFPISRTDLDDPEKIKQVCHYTNLQPLWAADNLKKSNKLDWSGDRGKNQKA